MPENPVTGLVVYFTRLWELWPPWPFLHSP